MSMKPEPTLFPIGKTAEICGVSARTLRFYEEHGLIHPDKVDNENRYRYYSYDTMRRIQTIRYLLDEGFALATIQDMLLKDDLNDLKEHFLSQIRETESEIRYQKQRLASLHAWCALLIEGNYVLEHRDLSVRTRYIEEQQYFHFHHVPANAEERTEAFLETKYFTESKKDGHTMIDMGGAFNVLYGSIEDRMANSASKITLLQTVYPDSESVSNTIPFGGFLAVACYHIGSNVDIQATYEKMLTWASDHGFTLQGNAFERQVLDIYSVSDENKYVTEILLPVAGDYSDVGKTTGWLQR